MRSLGIKDTSEQKIFSIETIYHTPGFQIPFQAISRLPILLHVHQDLQLLLSSAKTHKALDTTAPVCKLSAQSTSCSGQRLTRNALLAICKIRTHCPTCLVWTNSRIRLACFFSVLRHIRGVTLKWRKRFWTFFLVVIFNFAAT